MKVNELSACLATSQLYGDGDVEITDLQTDSRRVVLGRSIHLFALPHRGRAQICAASSSLRSGGYCM